jgi:hypothetical protein
MPEQHPEPQPAEEKSSWAWFGTPLDSLKGEQSSRAWPGLKRSLLGIAAVTLFVGAIVLIPTLIDAIF